MSLTGYVAATYMSSTSPVPGAIALAPPLLFHNATTGSHQMTIRTQLKAGGSNLNHNETLQVRSALKAGGWTANHNDALRVRSAVKAGDFDGGRGHNLNHNEALQVRSALKAGGWTNNHNDALRVRSAVKAGGWSNNHNEALHVRSAVSAARAGLNQNHNEVLNVRWPAKVTGLRQILKMTANKTDRLQLLVVRAGIRAGRRATRVARGGR